MEPDLHKEYCSISQYRHEHLYFSQTIKSQFRGYNLQRGVFTLPTIAKNFGMEISPEKSEMMAFLRQNQIRSKIVVSNQCLQQI